MKNYLRLFLIIVSFGYVFNVAQAEVPENISQLQNAVWKLEHPNGSFGTAFATGPHQFVTSFQTMLGVGEYGMMNLLSGTVKVNQTRDGVTRTLSISKIRSISASDDLVAFETKGDGDVDYLKLSERTSSEIVNNPGTLFALGYPRYPQNPQDPQDPQDPQGVQQALIGNYGITDVGESYSLAVNGTLLGYYMERGPKVSPYNIHDHSSNFLVFGGLMGAPVMRHKEVIGIVASGMNNMLDVIPVSKLKALRNLNCSNISSCIKQEIEDLKKQAGQGNTSAKKVLARMYYYGIGVNKNLEKAFKLISELADKGDDAQALYQKADKLYEEGKRKEAFKLYLKSGKKGYSPGLYAAASMLYFGDGVEIDTNLQNASDVMSERGYPPGLHAAASMLGDGVGIDTNLQNASDLMLESAEKGFAPGQLGYSVILSKRDNYSSRPEELERIKRWRIKAAEQGYYSAQVRVVSDVFKPSIRHYVDSMGDQQTKGKGSCLKNFKLDLAKKLRSRADLSPITRN